MHSYLKEFFNFEKIKKFFLNDEQGNEGATERRNETTSALFKNLVHLISLSNPFMSRVKRGKAPSLPAARTHAVTMAFDSWSLGCILGEMVTLRTTGSRSPGVLFANNPMALAMLMQVWP